MPWYAASVITYFRILEEADQDEFVVLENVYLLEAADDDDALRKAEECGRANVVEDDTLWAGGKPAREEFGGVRKVLSVAPNVFTRTNRSLVTRIEDGVEATFSSFTVRGRDRLSALISGQAVEVVYEED